MLRDSVTVVIVAAMRTRIQVMPLAMITMRKSTRGFSFLSYMSMGLCLAALQSSAMKSLSESEFTLHSIHHKSQYSLYCR